MNQAEFARRIEILAGLVSNATAFNEAYKGFWMHDESQKVLDTVNRYKGFLNPALTALLRTSAMELSKAIEAPSSRTDVISLTSLLAVARKDRSLVPNADSDEIPAIQRSMRPHATTKKKLKELRDTRFAHMDAAPQGALGVSREHFEALMQATQDGVSRLSVAHSRQAWDFTWDIAQTAAHHGDDVLQLLAGKRRIRR